MHTSEHQKIATHGDSAQKSRVCDTIQDIQDA
jgi:hypothetical protein